MERGKHQDDWRKLCDTRIEDAEVLLRNGRYDAAYYLAGYAVECALKARIIRVLQGYFPPKENLYVHKLTKLLEAAELGDELQRDPVFEAQWDTVKDWSEESRYETYDKRAAENMLEAARGVVKWTKRYW
ncbi:MAG: HEPN domain-containing protein [Terriglobia bacterium]